MSLPELIRITCNDPILRNDANKEGDESLIKAHVDLNVLFDNVRGFILRSKFNDNIVKSLYDEPQRFFYYNNGITIIANDIKSTMTFLGIRLKAHINKHIRLLRVNFKLKCLASLAFTNCQ